MVYHLQVSTSFWCYLWVDKFHSPRPDRWLEQYIKICIQYQDISWALMRRKDGKNIQTKYSEHMKGDGSSEELRSDFT